MDFNWKEYIIPQLVTEWVISTRCKVGEDDSVPSAFDGIMYSSIHSGNESFNYPIETLYNICLPAFDSCSPTFCKTLSKMFQVTEPTCYEYEVLNRNISIHSEALKEISEYEQSKAWVLRDTRITEDNKKDIVKNIDKSINYCKSRFKYVEDALSDRTLFPARDIKTD